MGLGQFLAFSGYLNGEKHGIEILLLILGIIILNMFPKPRVIAEYMGGKQLIPDNKAWYIIMAFLFLMITVFVGIKQYAVNNSALSLSRKGIICTVPDNTWEASYEDIKSVSYDEQNHVFMLNVNNEEKEIECGVNDGVYNDLTGIKAKIEKLKYEALRDIIEADN